MVSKFTAKMTIVSVWLKAGICILDHHFPSFAKNLDKTC